MLGAFLYVDAGKGHYTPAKALYDSFVKLKQEAVLEDLFVMMKTPFWHWFVKYYWRFMLHHPNYERKSSSKSDNPELWNRLLPVVVTLYKKKFRRWYEATQPDFILCTNFLGGVFLPALTKAINVDIPTYVYAADVFMSPQMGISNGLTKMYVPSPDGVRWVIEHGQAPGRTALCPFPLQQKFEDFSQVSRQEARTNLGLAEKFTVLLSLGGEGIGSTEFVEEACWRGLDIQVVLVGNLSKTTKMKYDLFSVLHPDFDIKAVGFVNNIHEYFLASDIVVGKQGANTLMESIYLHRPCLISELLYTADPSAKFLRENEIGWSESDPVKQVEIVQTCALDPTFSQRIEERFNLVPLRFSVDDFARQIIADTQHIQTTP
ncbi:MAG: glycosyltransferase [Sphaerochaetaceae bacterium]